MGGTPSHGLPQNLRPLWRRFRVTRDPTARDALITATIPLVRKIAARLALRLPPHLERADLESAGLPGLLAAIEGYDPDNDASFDTYAAPRIRGAIIDELRALDPLTRPLRVKARRIAQAVHALEQEQMRPPTDAEVADRLHIPLQSYHDILARLRGGLHVSIDTIPTHWAPSDPGLPGLQDRRAPDPLVCTALHERNRLLAILIASLPSAERMVLGLHYFSERNMKDIGKLLDLSESRVSQIHAVAIGRLRTRLRQRHIPRDDLHIEQPEARNQCLAPQR
ncbi:MAG: FliA/WhiG family RNA polymerase sigma factor [Candidatus Methylomirabilota bacterium]